MLPTFTDALELNKTQMAAYNAVRKANQAVLTSKLFKDLSELN